MADERELTDFELGQIVLRKFHERRSEGKVRWRQQHFPEMSLQTAYRICKQLHERGLVDCKFILDGRKIAFVFGEITGLGSLEIEQPSGPPTPMQHITINNSANVQIGNGNIQGVNLAVEASAPTISAVEYFSSCRKLDGRFFERDQFLKKVCGCRVTWSGYVNSVSECRTGLILTAVAEKGKHDYFFVNFEPPFATQLYALQKHDFVRVTGIIDSNIATSPRLDGVSVERLT